MTHRVLFLILCAVEYTENRDVQNNGENPSWVLILVGMFANNTIGYASVSQPFQ